MMNFSDESAKKIRTRSYEQIERRVMSYEFSCLILYLISYIWNVHLGRFL